MEQLRYAPLPDTTPSKPAKLVVSHKPIRDLSLQEQKLKMIQHIHELTTANEELSDKNEYLNNTISDLKKVLQFVGKESMEEGRSLRDANTKLKDKTVSLERTLAHSHKGGAHLQRCGKYWTLFVE